MWHDAWQTNWQIWTKRMTVKGVKPMSRMADLDAAIAELRKCGEAIISVSDALRTSFSTETEQPAPPPLPTIDQVRALLAEKSGEGKTKEVKALLNKYDAGKLSGVKPEDYPALMEEARSL